MREEGTAVTGIAIAALFLFGSGAALAQDSTAPSAERTDPARGWLGIGERNVWGLAAKGATADYGADLLAGRWFFREHLEPILDVGWSRVVRPGDGPAIDTFRAGGKLAVGSSVGDGHLWAGMAAGLVVQAGWLHGSSSADAAVVGGGTVYPSSPTTKSSLAWAVAPSVSALLRGRLAQRLLLGMEIGVEHSIPPLEWSETSIFHAFRFQAGVQLGVIFGSSVAPPTPTNASVTR